MKIEQGSNKRNMYLFVCLFNLKGRKQLVLLKCMLRALIIIFFTSISNYSNHISCIFDGKVPQNKLPNNDNPFTLL